MKRENSFDLSLDDGRNFPFSLCHFFVSMCDFVGYFSHNNPMIILKRVHDGLLSYARLVLDTMLSLYCFKIGSHIFRMISLITEKNPRIKPRMGVCCREYLIPIQSLKSLVFCPNSSVFIHLQADLKNQSGNQFMHFVSRLAFIKHTLSFELPSIGI